MGIATTLSELSEWTLPASLEVFNGQYGAANSQVHEGGLCCVLKTSVTQI